jgi:hypothetical protein
MVKGLMKKVPRYLIPTVSIVFIIGAFIAYLVYHNRTVLDDIQSYLQEIYRIERNFVENIPIYEDFATPERERALRRYLLPDHLRIAERYGIPPVKNDEEMVKLADRGGLTLVSGSNRLYYFYNVREKYRYLTPLAYRGLEKLTDRFQENLNKRAELPSVKIAISSLLRPLTYQKKLMGRNVNATIVSTHLYGTSFDIFYDDYYVSLTQPKSSSQLSGAILEELRRRFGFLLGDSLRRQFRSILMETLLQLQEEGVLYAILERRQRCYHVTILPDSNY